jgi:hypothetical protein
MPKPALSSCLAKERGEVAGAGADTFYRSEDLWQSHLGTLATHQTSGRPCATASWIKCTTTCGRGDAWK